jgi:hypothetical protein
MSRFYAGETAELVGRNAAKIAMGSGALDESEAIAFLESISHGRLTGCYPGMIGDMDRLADIIFER